MTELAHRDRAYVALRDTKIYTLSNGPLYCSRTHYSPSLIHKTPSGPFKAAPWADIDFRF